ncbi:MAG TPA: CapA family protein [Candidatus Methylomirabilis sp.]|jgi:poly-gamma-glutamate synthesis protein (capsule biosynthesis protein)
MGGRPAGGIALAAVGDVVLAREDPAAAFAPMAPLLRGADLRVANCEVALSNRGLPQHAKHEVLHSSPEMIAGLVAAGFDVLSLANNHTMDYGPEALLETIERLGRHGIACCGAGRDDAAAWRPAVVERRGLRVGFVACASEIYLGYAAHPGKPGIAVIRRDALYGPRGVNPDDLGRLAESLRAARRAADVVVLCCHWGLSQSRALTVSQRAIARAALRAGAHLVLGHHPHVLQGIQVARRRAVCFSLGNFVFDLPPPFLGPATRETMLVFARMDRAGVAGLAFHPARINAAGQPEPLESRSKDFEEAVARMRRMCGALKTRLAAQGNAVVARAA